MMVSLIDVTIFVVLPFVVLAWQRQTKITNLHQDLGNAKSKLRKTKRSLKFYKAYAEAAGSLPKSNDDVILISRIMKRNGVSTRIRRCPDGQLKVVNLD